MGRFMTMTSKESIALNLIFGSLGESPFNRSMDDYLAIAVRACVYRKLDSAILVMKATENRV